ncbi:MAG: homoserine O-acetyltransferase/O-succinyltransferase family protein, partial [Candidatus Binataceae bacterium]
RWCIPHSRHNGLAEEALVSKGYRIVARSREAGVDTFIRDQKSLYIFLQGHPEYDRAALLREYRRDVGRFLSRERDSYPEMPQRYFDEAAASVFSSFQRRAQHDRSIALHASFPAAVAEGKLAYEWYRPAVHLYSNWLAYLSDRKTLNI